MATAKKLVKLTYDEVAILWDDQVQTEIVQDEVAVTLIQRFSDEQCNRHERRLHFSPKAARLLVEALNHFLSGE